MLERSRLRRTARWAAPTVLLASSACLAVGCASARPEAELPPQSLAVERSTAPPTAAPDIPPLEPIGGATEPLADSAVQDPRPVVEPAPPVVTPSPAPTVASAAPAEAEGDPTVVVIDKSDAAGQEDTAALLRDLSRAERERRQAAPQPRLVLNDDNIAAHAAGARVTFSAPPAEAAADKGKGEAAADSVDEDGGELERYWRSRALDVRQRWRRAYDDIPRLEGEVERLRTAFYSEDDPVRRDRQIKPLWDRALDRLQEARDEVERSQEELDVLLAEGKAAGALDGWLREGNELEPPYEPPAAEGEAIDELSPDEPTSVEPLAQDPPR